MLRRSVEETQAKFLCQRPRRIPILGKKSNRTVTCTGKSTTFWQGPTAVVPSGTDRGLSQRGMLPVMKWLLSVGSRTNTRTWARSWCYSRRSSWSRSWRWCWTRLKVDFNVVDPQDPSPETGISESRLVKSNARQIDSMKKRRPFCVGTRRPVAAREDPTLWDRR